MHLPSFALSVQKSIAAEDLTVFIGSTAVAAVAVKNKVSASIIISSREEGRSLDYTRGAAKNINAPKI